MHSTVRTLLLGTLPLMPRSLAVPLALLVSGILIAGGAILFISATQASASFGWFAYQPLSGAVFMSPDLILLTPLAAVGIGIGVVGLTGLALLVGFVIGRGSRAR